VASEERTGSGGDQPIGPITAGAPHQARSETLPPASMPTTPGVRLERPDGRPRRLALRVVEGPDRGKMAWVDASTIAIGRASDNQLQLTDHTVSRVHCRLERVGESFLLRDAGSRHGTFVNGMRIFEVALERGSHVQLGGTRVELELVHEDSSPPTKAHYSFGELVGAGESIRRTFAELEVVARNALTCLLLGETGTGKELAARAVHDRSARAANPFIVIDCAGVSANLIEDKLFGHTRGAFTGAIADARGAFEEAHKGTIFLDEIGELPLALQPKLLRVLERREVTRLGSHRNAPVDVRVLAATHRDLQGMVASGDFRKDLFFRLSETTVVLPPLRHRKEDVAPLARHIIESEWGQAGTFDPRGLAMLEQHPWPGNVRELRNVLRRVQAASPNGFVSAEAIAGALDMGPASSFDPEEVTSLTLTGTGLPIAQARDEYRREYLKHLVERHGEDHAAIARHMRVHIKYARRLMRRYGLIP
jgi:transcriptional regulator with GAF, ATPase, and Fis domain